MNKVSAENFLYALLNNQFWGIINSPLSVLYSSIISLKNFFYDSRPYRQKQLNAAVISIGNIYVGGTGKTPLVEETARLFHKNGYNTAVLSRGYGGKADHVICVSDGKRIKSNAVEAGDEPMQLAKNLKGIPVIVGKNKINAGRYAEKKFNSRILILDDGFQHRKLHRDIDIITIDAVNPWGNGKVLPGGPLREPLSSLCRGDIFIITRSKNKDINSIKSTIRKYSNSPIYSTFHNPVCFYSSEREKITLDSFKKKSVLAFAGIGNPKSFFNTLEHIGLNINKTMAFPDHYYYTSGDLKKIFSQASKKHADAVITTEKDFMRIQTCRSSTPLYYLRIELKFTTKIDNFKKTIESILKASQ